MGNQSLFGGADHQKQTAPEPLAPAPAPATPTPTTPTPTTSPPIPSEGQQNAPKRAVWVGMPLDMTGGPLLQSLGIQHSAAAVMQGDKVIASGGTHPAKLLGGETTIEDHNARIEKEIAANRARIVEPKAKDPFLGEKEIDVEKLEQELKQKSAAHERTGNYGVPRSTPSGGTEVTICHTDTRRLLRGGLSAEDAEKVNAEERAKRQQQEQYAKQLLAKQMDIDVDD